MSSARRVTTSKSNSRKFWFNDENLEHQQYVDRWWKDDELVRVSCTGSPNVLVGRLACELSKPPVYDVTLKCVPYSRGCYYSVIRDQQPVHSQRNCPKFSRFFPLISLTPVLPYADVVYSRKLQRSREEFYAYT